MKESVHLLRPGFVLLVISISISSMVSGQWVKKADGLKPRAELGETIVYKSKVYAFVGFSDTSRHAEHTSEVYDPATDKWSYLASMPANTAMTHQDVVLVDNTVWHIGGRVGRHPAPMSSVIWIYNITTNAWSKGPEIRNPATGNPLVIAASASVLLGRVLHIFGGFTPNACTDQDKYHLTLDVDTWLSNPSLPAQWENKLKPMPLKRNHLSTAILGGKIYAIGGQTGHDCGTVKDVAYCHVYNPSTDSWKALTSTPTARSHAEGSTFAMDGKIYLVGGQGSDNKSTTKVTTFDPAGNNGAGTWTENTSLMLPRIFEGLSAKVIGSTFIVSHGSHGSSIYPAKDTYTRTITRNPVYQLGFPEECLNLHDSSANSLKGHTWLFTIDSTKNYTTSSSAPWLVVSKNATGLANSNAVDIEVTANTTGLAAGNYMATVTATGTPGGTSFTAATLCVSLTVVQSTEPLQYNLHVTSNGIGSVSKDPDEASYASGSSVVLTATPGEGQRFTGWSGDAGGTDNPLTVIMNAEKEITATFADISTSVLTITTDGEGTVTRDPDQSSYENGETVSLTADPAAGQQFTGWSGDVNSIDNPLSVTMDMDKSVTATFEQIPGLISNIKSGSSRNYVLGELTVGTTFYSDRTYQVTAVPAFLDNAPLIKTPNDDKSNNTATLLSFDLNKAATVYVAYDPRATALPSWLGTWQKVTSDQVGIYDPKISYMILYSKNFAAGKVNLGGNMVSPAKGAQSNYFVVAKALAQQRTVGNSRATVLKESVIDRNTVFTFPSQNVIQSLKVYPNPNPGDKLHIDVKNSSKNETVSITLKDAFGRTVKSTRVTTGNDGAVNKDILMPVHIAKGLYIISIVSSSGNVQQKIIVD